VHLPIGVISQLHREFADYQAEAKTSKYSVQVGFSAVVEKPRDALCPSIEAYNISNAVLLLVTSASDLPLRIIKCGSVGFSVRLRLLVINTSSSVSREQQ